MSLMMLCCGHLRSLTSCGFPSSARHRPPTLSPDGTDAPMCQDTRSGGLNDLLASAEIGHDALVDLSRKEAFAAVPAKNLIRTVRVADRACL